MKADASIVWLCPDCEQVKPLTSENWYFDSNGDKRSGACRACKRRKQRDYAAANRDEVNRRKREQHARNMASPHKRARKRRQWKAANKKRLASERGREQLRRASRKYRQKVMADPERRAEWNEKHREISRRYYERLKADPRRYAAYLAYKRGERPTTVPDPRLMLTGHGGGLVDPAPLVELVEAWLARQPPRQDAEGKVIGKEPVGELARAAQVSERLIYSLRTGERRRVSVDAADRVCIALGLHLIDVYPDLYEFDDEESEAA